MSTQLSEFPTWPREKRWNMCTPNWAGRPVGTFTSHGFATNDHEKTGSKLKRRARVTNKGEASSTVQVWSYNCESCLVPGRMAELLYTAKGRGADVVCLQGTQMTMETPWTHGQWYVTPVARTAHRAADGVIIAVSLQRFSKESIVTHHVWQPGRLLGVRVKAGQGSAEVDTYFACGICAN